MMRHVPFHSRSKRLGVLLAATVVSSAWASAHPTLHSASERYRDHGAHPATGRSGNASLSVRALTGRSGETTLEATTASFDDGSVAPGNIGHLQLKVFDANGGTDVRQFGDMGGGTVSLRFGDLSRKQQLQLQANIRGIDGNRTDVVTVSTTVLLRPDLAVRGVVAPTSVNVNTPVNVSAEIAELNGDVGARGDCVLSVDGQEVDRAKGIWVDAGGAVSCAFTHTFTTAGNKAVSISVANVAPTDDYANDDSATATIQVIEDAPFHYTASVQRTDYTSSWVSERHLSSDDGTRTVHADTGASGDNSGYTEQSNFHGELRALAFPISVDVVESSDGASTGEAHFADVSADSTTTDATGTRSCASRFDANTSGYLFLCVLPNSKGTQITQVDWMRYSGQVTYFGTSFGHYWLQSDATGATTDISQWAYNSADQSSDGGPAWNVGASYSFDVKVASGSDGEHASPTFATQSNTATQNQPKTCVSSMSGTYQQELCNSSTSTTHTVGGQISNFP